MSHYRVLERLDAVGMGLVYKAEDIRVDRFIALKFLPIDSAHDPDLPERFRRDTSAAVSREHF